MQGQEKRHGERKDVRLGEYEGAGAGIGVVAGTRQDAGAGAGAGARLQAYKGQFGRLL